MKFLVTIAAMLFATSVSAATVDFVAEAAGNERGLASGSVITDIGNTGLDVKLSTSQGNYVYLDDLSSGRPGGLGACSSLTGSAQCSPSSDDNVDAGEAFVNVMFGFTGTGIFSAGSVDQVTLFNAGHNLFAGLIDINGSIFDVTNGVIDFVGGFDFGSDGLTFSWVDTDFYVGQIGSDNVGIDLQPVPLPAAAWMLLAGLMGMFGLRRRKPA